ncbi:MAG: sigma-70 family RNA polymerase sigma factor [Drouetiella hepatica Uher 2000/2452]|uniref:Sigma-70 family RNA polymerase sigma factor n=1 Tax=Drouetiella hepatica Uher 2000/2452 TaxID=904376 RepID=A0A951UQA8_9CYAN|nr:sigma-70 family RNA polymerase sigma factor [Drouetiella hepatica Uher 2000/2452]
MRTRQGLLEIFSTFLQFKADAFGGWVTDPKLRRSMQTCLSQSAQEESELFWALYWHQIWQTQASPIAASHLTAYLQEVCYWTARKLALKLSGNHSIADFFQTAIARIDKVYRNFNPQFSSSLKSYAELVLSGTIKNQVEKQEEVAICTDWALLHRTSHKRLVEALQFSGESPEAIARYVLAWNCFKQLYAPSTAQTAQRLSRPEYTTWQAIAQVYNAEQLSQLSSTQTCSPENLEKWLLVCAKAVRVFLYPAKISIHTPIPGQETSELMDYLPGSIQESLLAEAIAQEETEIRETQGTQINQVLATAVTQLDTEAQILLQLYYQQALTQQQIAQHLGMKQYTVSRRLNRLRQTLLSTLAQWSQQTLHIPLTSSVLDSMSSAIEEWLNAYYLPPHVTATATESR